MKITAIISSGHGRLHFAQSAEWLARAGVAVKLVCGWVPRRADSLLVKVCSRIVGRNLSAGMKKRAQALAGGGEVCQCALTDFIVSGMFLLERRIMHGRLYGQIGAIGWRLFGLASRRWIKRFTNARDVVFHVRSGAGHGGAIRFAHKIGLPVVVDHSIAHPAYMEKHLRDEYLKNGEHFSLGTSSPFWRMVAEDCSWADMLLVNSFFVRDTFIEQGYPAEKIRVVYLGTRPDFFGIRAARAHNRDQRKLKLLFTGNFSFRKGAEYLLEAIRILSERSKVPFEMDVVGSFDKAIVEAFDVKSLPIVFNGPVPQDELKGFLARSDIYVFPSLAEGCACSGMEAMAAGLCVVGTHESGFPIEDGVNGCIVPGKDAQAIVDKVLSLMDNPSEIDRLGAAAAELIRTKYTWEQYAENVKRIYEELLSR